MLEHFRGRALAGGGREDFDQTMTQVLRRFGITGDVPHAAGV